MTQHIPNAGQALPAPAPQQQAGGAQQYNGPQAGLYNMRAVDAELGFTQGTESEPAKPQVAVLLEFVDGPYRGTSITWYGFFTEKTRQSTLRALRTLGWQGDDVSDLSTVRGEAPCTVQVEADLTGVPRPRIRFIGGGVIAMKNTMTDEQKKAFAASMKAFAAGVTASTPTENTNAAPPSGGAAPSGKPGEKFF